MLARLLCNKDEYDSLLEKVEDTIIALIPEENPSILKEIVRVCHLRNFIFRTMHDKNIGDRSVSISSATRTALRRAKYPGYATINGDWELSIDNLTEKVIRNKLFSDGKDFSILKMSQVLEQVKSRSYMEPKLAQIMEVPT